MGLKSCLLGAALAGVCFCIQADEDAARAAGCEPQLAAALPITESTSSTLLVPAEIDGKAGSLMLDTGSSYSMMRGSVADELGLQRDDIPDGVYGLAGRSIGQRTRAHSLQLGSIVEADRGFLIAPPNVPVDPRALGILGGDVIGDFNVELDPIAHQLKLYIADSCPGGVPGWAAKTPPTSIDVTPDNQVVFTAALDGKPVKAYLDTGATYSILDLSAAKRAYGLDRDSPGLEAVGGTRTGDGAMLDTFLYHFKQLDVAGVNFSDPLVSLVDERRRAHPDTGTRIDLRVVSLPDFRVGMHQLRQLHVYIDYDRRKLYVEPNGPVPDKP
jgi:predicted aspartyl protease